MTIHWHFLAIALLMLCYPRQWMRFGKLWRKRRKERETLERFAQDGANDPEDKSVRLVRELRNKRNYLDFFRALAGGLALWHFSFEAGPEQAKLVFWLCAAISTVVVLIQSVRMRERITFYAAIFFYAGLSSSMGNYYPGALAFLLVCAINPVIPNPRMFTVAYALLLLPFTFFLGDSWLLALFNTALLLLAPLWSLLVKRPMVIYTRRRNLTW